MQDFAEQVLDGRPGGIVKVLQGRAVPDIAGGLNQGQFKYHDAIRFEKTGCGAEGRLEVREVLENGNRQHGVETACVDLLHAAVEEIARDHSHARLFGLLSHVFVQLNAKAIVSVTQQLQGTDIITN